MSMITQMLKDLDARQAGGGGASAITAGVVLLEPPTHRSGRSRVLLMAGGCLALAGLWLWYSGGPAEPSLVVSAPPSVEPAAEAVAKDLSQMPVTTPAVEPPQAKIDAEPAVSATPTVATAVLASVAETVTTPLSNTELETLPLLGADTGERNAKVKAVSPPRDSAAAQAAKARKDSDGALQKATALSRQSQVDEALVAARQAVNDNPTNHRARQLLIDLMIAAGKGEEARLSLSDGLEFAPGNSGFYMRLACLQMAARAPADALVTMQQGQFAAEDNADYQTLFEAVRGGQVKPGICSKLSPHR